MAFKRLLKSLEIKNARPVAVQALKTEILRHVQSVTEKAVAEKSSDRFLAGGRS